MSTDYDVLIVGSGASGGMAAYTLTKKGIKCLMLDAGPNVDFTKQRVLKPVYELPFRGLGEPGRLPHVLQANEFNANQWVDERQVPYTHDAKEPYNWVRVRMLGGKSNFWARMSFRLSDFEFKAKDHDGFGENWPISYADLAPYYDQVEPILRVAGLAAIAGWSVPGGQLAGFGVCEEVQCVVRETGSSGDEDAAGDGEGSAGELVESVVAGGDCDGEFDVGSRRCGA